MSDTESNFEEQRQEFDPLSMEKPTLDPRAKARLRKKPGRKPKGTNWLPPGTYQSIWSPQKRADGTPGPQYALLSCPFQEIFFGGARGGGKSLALDENVLCPSGYRKMRDIAIGDEICAPGGEVTKVIGVYPQGVEDVFLVTLVDGRTVRASADHLWRVKLGRDCWGGQRAGPGTVSTASIAYLLESGEDVHLPVKTLDYWVPVLSIHYDGKAETQCIKVDRPDGLFITNDHVITHNTDGAIGVWLEHAARYGQHAKGLFLRRQYANLKDVLDRMNMLFPKIGASFNKGEGVWLFPNGANLKLGHLWDETATNAYQGHQYCVAEGTPVLMGDGSYRPIQDIAVGELVMTLEGPKPVLATMEPRLSPCVRVQTFDASGKKVGEQIHPEDHPVLTTVSRRTVSPLSTSRESSPFSNTHALERVSKLHRAFYQDPVSLDRLPDLECPTARTLRKLPDDSSRTSRKQLESPSRWQSYTTLLDAHLRTQENSVYQGDGQTDYTSSVNSLRETGRLPRLSCRVVLHGLGHQLREPLREKSSEFHASRKLVGPSRRKHPNFAWSPSGQQQQLEPVRSPPDFDTEHLAGDAPCALLERKKAQDFQFGYLSDFCFCDGRFHPVQECEPSRAPLPDDAVLRSRAYSCKDGEDSSPSRNRPSFGTYSHPYTGEHRNLTQPCEYGLAVLEPCEPHVVYDLTVAQANHYITDTLMANKNTAIFIEEVTQWPTPMPIDMMRATLRSAHGVPTKLIMTGNPGGAGHGWVRERYVSPAPAGYTPIDDPKTGSTRIYIPSRVTDNTILMKNDPNYITNLKQAGSENLVRAWLEGDWNIVAGGFFSDIIDPDTHYLKPFEIPATWRYRRSFDWGSAAPAALGIWAVSDGNPVDDLDGFVFPRGSLILVKEWYTVARKDDGTLQPNVGQRLTNLALGNGIAQRSMQYNFSGCVADPSIFAKPGRESIYDEMRKGAAEVGHTLIFTPADNNRVAGWQRMRDMLANARKPIPEKEGMWVFETCSHWIRTVPVLQRDEAHPDDIDTGSEDHMADSARYISQTGVRSMVVGDLTGR